MARVLVLNATYEPINVCTLRRAAVLLLKEKAELLERRQGALHSERMTIERPDVIRLVSYVRIPREAHRRKITRRAVLARDSWTCQYCGSRKSGLTVDHVIPLSRGGKSVSENIVAACATCNRRSRKTASPGEIQMHPRKRPRAPGPTHVIQVASPKHPAGLAAVLTRGSLKSANSAGTPAVQTRPARPSSSTCNAWKNLMRCGVGATWAAYASRCRRRRMSRPAGCGGRQLLLVRLLLGGRGRVLDDEGDGAHDVVLLHVHHFHALGRAAHL